MYVTAYAKASQDDASVYFMGVLTSIALLIPLIRLSVLLMKDKCFLNSSR